MKVSLYLRHNGCHRHIRDADIPCALSDCAIEVARGDWAINESKLLDELPEGFLLSPPNETLLTVGNENGSIGQSELSKFKPWSKYHNAYVLELKIN